MHARHASQGRHVKLGVCVWRGGGSINIIII